MGETHTIDVAVAGFGFRFRASSPARDLIASRFQAFLAQESLDESARAIEDVTEIEVELDDDYPLPSAPTVTVNRVGNDLRLLGPHVDARVSRSLGSARLAGPLSERPVDALLRMLLSARLLRRGGLLGHASAVLIGGRAWLFPGPSGIGKTTAATRLAAAEGLGASILCDEAVAVLPGAQGELIAHATPYWRAEPVSAPVAAMLFPRRGPRQWRRLSKGTATARLISSVGPLLPEAVPGAFSVAARMVQKVETAEVCMNRVEDVEEWLAPTLASRLRAAA